MTIYSDFPSINPSATTWELVQNTRFFRSPVTNAVQTVGRKGAFWHVTMTFSNLQTAERAQLQAFITKLNGQEHKFVMHDHAYVRRGTGGGSPVTTASQTGSTVNITAATADVDPWLMAGDYLSFDNELKMCTEDCETNGSGAVTVKIAPAIRKATTAGAVDIVAPVVGVFMLVSNPQWTNEIGLVSTFDLELVEDVIV